MLRCYNSDSIDDDNINETTNKSYFKDCYTQKVMTIRINIIFL